MSALCKALNNAAHYPLLEKHLIARPDLSTYAQLYNQEKAYALSVPHTTQVRDVGFPVPIST